MKLKTQNEVLFQELILYPKKKNLEMYSHDGMYFPQWSN